MTMYRVRIDPGLCSGFGSCARLAPGSIELDASGLAAPRAGETADDAVLEAAASCPMGAIEVEEVRAA